MRWRVSVWHLRYFAHHVADAADFARVNVEAGGAVYESFLANGHSLIQTMNIRVEN